LVDSGLRLPFGGSAAPSPADWSTAGCCARSRQAISRSRMLRANVPTWGKPVECRR